MQPRHLYPGALVLVILVLGGIAFSRGMFSSPDTTYIAPVDTVQQDTAAVDSSGTTAPTETPTETTYTLADVAKHATRVSCWTTIGGSVYDLTSFIPMHPGGDRILAICGIDGTSAFEAQHGNTRSAQSELATLKIGTLIP